MKHRVGLLLGAVAIALASGYMGFVIGVSRMPAAAGDDTGDEGEAVAFLAKVKLGAVEQTTVEEKVVAFGSVAPMSGEARTLSLKFDATVARLAVVPGQAVPAGATLVVLTATPEAALSLAEARDGEEAAAKELAQAEQRIAMKLGTAGELVTAKGAERAARTRLESLEKRAIGKTTIVAPAAGIVSKIYASAGQIVSAGAPIAELMLQSGIGVTLGVEPADAPRITADQVVRVSAVEGAGQDAFMGHVRLVAQAIDPTSRLVEVFVGLDAPASLLMDARVRGEIVTATHPARVVPREAVLPEGDAHIVFTVEKGRAVRHEIAVGIDDGRLVELLGEALGVGRKVVIEGAVVLEDGMSVEALP